MNEHNKRYQPKHAQGAKRQSVAQRKESVDGQRHGAGGEGVRAKPGGRRVERQSIAQRQGAGGQRGVAHRQEGGGEGKAGGGGEHRTEARRGAGPSVVQRKRGKARRRSSVIFEKQHFSVPHYKGFTFSENKVSGFHTLERRIHVFEKRGFWVPHCGTMDSRF